MPAQYTCLPAAHQGNAAGKMRIVAMISSFKYYLVLCESECQSSSQQETLLAFVTKHPSALSMVLSSHMLELLLFDT
jgi:hypothetical protein